MANEKFLSTLVIGSETYTLDPDYLGGRPATEYATKELITAGLHYRGKLTPPCSTPEAEVGDVYVVETAGKVNGIDCEAGDLWMCHSQATTEGDSTKWDIIQGNIDMTALDNKYADIEHTHVVPAHETDLTSITPQGEVSQPTFTGTKAAHKHTASQGDHSHTFTGEKVTPTGTFTGSSLTSSGTYKPEGTISKITHTPAGSVTVTAGNSSEYTPAGTVGKDGSHSHTGKVSIDYTPAGSVTISKGTGTANYTPAGTIPAADAHNHDVKVSVSYTPAGSIEGDGAHGHTVSASATYTPAGTISEHNHTLSPETKSFITGVSLTKAVDNSSADSVWGKPTYTSSSKTLTIPLALFGVSGATADAVTGITSAAASTTFTGTKATITSEGTAASETHTHTFAGTQGTIAGDFTTTDAGAHDHIFTGTGAHLAASFAGTQTTLEDTDLEISTAPAHSHGFTGTQVDLGGSFEGTEFSVTPTFTGTSKTISVTGTPEGTIAINPFTPEGTLDAVSAGAITIDNTDITPEGTVSKPTFTGTASNHTHTIKAVTTGTGTEG